MSEWDCAKCGKEKGINTEKIVLLDMIHTRLCQGCLTEYDFMIERSVEYPKVEDLSLRINAALARATGSGEDVSEEVLTYKHEIRALETKLVEMAQNWLKKIPSEKTV